MNKNVKTFHLYKERMNIYWVWDAISFTISTKMLVQKETLWQQYDNCVLSVKGKVPT